MSRIQSCDNCGVLCVRPHSSADKYRRITQATQKIGPNQQQDTRATTPTTSAVDPDNTRRKHALEIRVQTQKHQALLADGLPPPQHRVHVCVLVA